MPGIDGPSPDFERVFADLAELTTRPIHQLHEQSSRQDLLAQRADAVRMLDWLDGQRRFLEPQALNRKDIWIELGSWGLGIVSFVTSVIDGIINGLSNWAVAGLLLAPAGFALAAWQTQRRIDEERTGLDAIEAWGSQVQLVHAAIDRIDLALPLISSPKDEA